MSPYYEFAKDPKKRLELVKANPVVVKLKIYDSGVVGIWSDKPMSDSELAEVSEGLMISGFGGDVVCQMDEDVIGDDPKYRCPVTSRTTWEKIKGVFGLG
jgi:hypothetical protein